MRALGVVLAAAVWTSGCDSEAPTPEAPARDAAVDAQVDAAAPAIQIQAGELQFEVEAAPDAGPDAAPKLAKAAPAPRKARRAPRRARPKPKAKPASGSAMQTIRANMRDVEHCYGRVALKDPSIKGRIVVQWTLGRTGKPTGTAILKDTLKDKSVGQCIRKKAKAWRFPPPGGGVSVITYPFDLRVQ